MNAGGPVDDNSQSVPSQELKQAGERPAPGGGLSNNAPSFVFPDGDDTKVKSTTKFEDLENIGSILQLLGSNAIVPLAGSGQNFRKLDQVSLRPIHVF